MPTSAGAVLAMPKFIPPMLPKSGQPFDSERHFFEVKWDAMRTLAFVEPQGYRLVNRRRPDVTTSYPELAFLADLPRRTVLDGELVVMNGSRLDLDRVLARIRSSSGIKVRVAARSTPATFVAFDQLYSASESIMGLPLTTRRAYLADTVGQANLRGSCCQKESKAKEPSCSRLQPPEAWKGSSPSGSTAPIPRASGRAPGSR